MRTTPPPPSANLRAELARAGLLQRDVAALLNLTQPQISERLRCEIPWRVTELQILAAHLNVPISRLIDEPVTNTDPTDQPATTAPAVSS